MGVDIRLLDYLLSSSVATLKSLAIALNDGRGDAKDWEAYFGELVICSPPRPDPDDSHDRTAR